MASGNAIDDVARLLHHEAPDRRFSAGIVLGELKVRRPTVIKGLVSMLESGAPPLQRPALEALARIGAPRAVPAMLTLLGARDPEVRANAIEAIVACGEQVVEQVKARVPTAHGDERKALDAILARFGDHKEAVTTILQNLEAADSEIARAVQVIDAMLEAAEAPDRMLAQAAIMGLAAVDLPPRHAARIARLVAHPDPERARIAIEKLARQPGNEVTQALIDVVVSPDRRRRELAAVALGSRPDAGPLLAEALAVETNPHRANALRFAIRPHASPRGTPQGRRRCAGAAFGGARMGSPRRRGTRGVPAGTCSGATRGRSQAQT